MRGERGHAARADLEVDAPIASLLATVLLPVTVVSLPVTVASKLVTNPSSQTLKILQSMWLSICGH